MSCCIKRYYTKIINATSKSHYDYIFFIKGESVSTDILRKLKVLHPTAKFILYHWDSIANNRNALRIANYFDVIFSFDKLDCDKYGWNFLPLFYGADYSAIADSRDYKYDIMFVGTTHGDRYKLVHQICDQLGVEGCKCYIYFYFPSIMLYIKMKLQDKYIRRASKAEFHFRPMSQKEVVAIVAKSNVVIDIQHSKQSGLTMRSIEALGAKRKLLTTNVNIIHYDFYNTNNIQIIDRDNPKINESFLLSSYEDIPIDIYNQYSIDMWIKAIIC